MQWHIQDLYEGVQGGGGGGGGGRGQEGDEPSPVQSTEILQDYMVYLLAVLYGLQEGEGGSSFVIGDLTYWPRYKK